MQKKYFFAILFAAFSFLQLKAENSDTRDAFIKSATHDTSSARMPMNASEKQRENLEQVDDVLLFGFKIA